MSDPLLLVVGGGAEVAITASELGGGHLGRGRVIEAPG